MQRQRDTGRSRTWPTARWLGRLTRPVLALALGGCLDLDLPNPPDGGVAPALSILIPQAGDVLTLSSLISLAAESVGGSPTVTLSCGAVGGTGQQIQVYAWAAAPYQAFVDFSRCAGLAPADAGVLGMLQLHVEALNPSGGAKAVRDVVVRLDATVPLLFLVFPPTVQPLSRFEVRVIPSGPLGGYPEVALDGTPADSVSSDALPDGGLEYLAVFLSTPGLGIDRYPGPFPNPVTGLPPIPIEVLTETSRQAPLTVDAKAPNGNPTHLDLTVEISRVVWDRPIPGRPLIAVNSATIAEPAVTAEGLILPLATDDLNPTAASRWIPGLMAAGDGTYTPFDPGILPGGLDGGYLARGINARGQTLFSLEGRTSSDLQLVPVPGRPGTGPTTNVPVPTSDAPLTRVDDLLCLPDFTNVAAGTCSDTAVQEVICLTPALGAAAAIGTGYTGPPSPGAVAGSARRYLASNASTCGAIYSFANLDTQSYVFPSRSDPNRTGCGFDTITRLLSLPDGSFVLALTETCQTGPEFPILRISSAGNIIGSYTVPLGAPAPAPKTVVAAMPDGRVVTLRNQPPYTVFELWNVGKAAPDATALVAGLYEYDDSAALPMLGRNLVAAADGSFAVLLSGAPLGVGVAAFGPGLTPRWFDLYPRLTSTNTQRLFGKPELGEVYLVDGFNNRVSALQLNPPVAGVPDAGPSPDAGSDAGTDGGPEAGVDAAG